jgi:hypothetical protein
MENKLIEIKQWLKESKNPTVHFCICEKEGIEEINKLISKLESFGVKSIFVESNKFEYSDNLYLKVGKKVSIELMVMICKMRPDEVSMENNLIRLWWD